MKSLGTILPTAHTWKIHNKVERKENQIKEEIAAKYLAHLTPRNEQGETRYYDGPNKYAIVGRSGRVLWFEIKKDGHYAVK